MCILLFFFFSSRRRHTRLQGDWSSDVCSSDLSARRPRMMTCDRPCSTRWRMTPILACALKPSMFLSDLCSTANRKRWRPTPRRPCRQTVRKRLSRWNAWFALWNNCSTGIPAVTCGCAAPPPYGKLALVKCSSRPEIVSTMNAIFQQGPFSVARRVALLSVLRSEEHTSELQSPCNLVCRLLLEKKKESYNSSDACSFVSAPHS